MAKQMFYTLDEVAERLGLDQQGVKDLAAEGKLQQFRDRDQLMFKRDEVETLASAGETTADASFNPDDTAFEPSLNPGDTASDTTFESLLGSDDTAGGTSFEPTLNPDDTAGDSGPIPLADSGDTDSGGEIQLSSDDAAQADQPAQPDAVELSGDGGPDDSAISFVDEDAPPDLADDSAFGQPTNAADETGVSVFDADEVEQADPTAQTQVNQSAVDNEELVLDNVGSGSGLLDLTRESDDTSLGAAELLDEIGPTSGGNEGSALGASGILEASHASQDPHSASAGMSAMETGTQMAMEQPEEVVGDSPMAAAMEFAEPYDPAGSGFGAGMLVGAGAALVLSLLVVAAALFGARSPVLDLMVGEPGAENASTMLLIWCGGLLAGSILLGIVGMLVGKAAANSGGPSASA